MPPYFKPVATYGYYHRLLTQPKAIKPVFMALVFYLLNQNLFTYINPVIARKICLAKSRNLEHIPNINCAKKYRNPLKISN